MGGVVPAHLRLLARLTPRAHAAALAAALPVASPDEVDGLAPELLRLATTAPDLESLIALAGVWPRLLDDARGALRELAHGHWSEIAGVLAGAPDRPRRLALAHIAAEVPDVAVASCLPGLLLDSDLTVAAAAESTILALAARAAATGSPDWIDAAQLAVAGAVSGDVGHRRPGPAVALVRLLSCLPGVSSSSPLAKVLADESLPVHAEVRRLIRKSMQGVSAAAAWRLLRVPAWAPACLDRLAQAPLPSESPNAAPWSECLGLGHLLAHPARRAGLRRLAARPVLAEVIERLAAAADDRTVTARTRKALPSWMAATASRSGDFDRLAGTLLNDASAAVRYNVVRTAAARRPVVLPVLLDLGFDADSRCARSAVLAAAPWQRTGRLEDPALDAAARGLRRSPHPRVRDLAAQIRLEPEGWFAGDARARLAAREAISRDPARVIAAVRARLSRAHGTAPVGAAQLAVDLGIVADVEIELLALLQSTDQRGHAAASAASVLGHISTHSSATALRSLLSSPDARVRANALDALVRRTRRADLGDPLRTELRCEAVELAMDPQHRVRAGALRAVLLLSPRGEGSSAVGVAGLGSMLSDERPMHRIAGLWLAERVAPDGPGDGWGEIACRVSYLFNNDPERVVRTRAGRCAEGLLARFRSDWAARACAPSGPPSAAMEAAL